jgi:hypothetical protein
MGNQIVDQKDWSEKQRRITDATTGITALGAGALGAAIAGKTKTAGKVLPKKVHRALRSGKADDVRNSIALASMLGGVYSGINWSKKLRSDAQSPPEGTPAAQREAMRRAVNYAAAMDIEKGIVPSSIMPTIRGLRMRRSYYRRTPLPRPRRA